ncbi:MAG: hypothetical protein QHH15_02465 [Candidatus Thermoplasmatota archaeon]|nr:hypothetical protein [Candidatus Thermoplasmatota archaeon]
MINLILLKDGSINLDPMLFPLYLIERTIVKKSVAKKPIKNNEKQKAHGFLIKVLLIKLSRAVTAAVIKEDNNINV